MDHRLVMFCSNFQSPRWAVWHLRRLQHHVQHVDDNAPCKGKLECYITVLSIRIVRRVLWQMSLSVLDLERLVNTIHLPNSPNQSKHWFSGISANVTTYNICTYIQHEGNKLGEC